MTSQFKFLYFFSSLLPLILACHDDEFYVIRSEVYRDLVLDGSDPEGVKLQKYNESASQEWKFERGDRAGLYYIINRESGKAMDCILTHRLLLGTKELRHLMRQQWDLSLDGRIVNAENRRVADIAGAEFKEGAIIASWDDNGTKAQAFVIDKVNLNSLQVPKTNL